MKNYLIKIVVFFTIVAFLDYPFGRMCDYLRIHSKGGNSANVYYICEQCKEDIIMMGSSRMKRHYVPQVFEDSLGMTCYNAGIDGNGIILNYGFLEMILQRYTPKLIIYDVINFDMYKDDNIKYLANLRPYYYKPGIKEIFEDVEKSERWKMFSNTYRYNSTLLELIGNNLHPLNSFDNGYWPGDKVMDYEPVPPIKNNYEVDLLKLEYVEKFIDLAQEHNIQIVFSVSPSYFSLLMADFNDPIKSICRKKDVPFVDIYYDNEICSNKRFWSDAFHMNDAGARLFSQKMAGKIRYCLGHLF